MSNIWAYCQKCGEGMGQPTPRDLALGQQECRHCGELRETTREEMADMLEAFAEAIKLLMLCHDEDHNVSIPAVMEIRGRINADVKSRTKQ